MISPLPSELWLQIADYLERPSLNLLSRSNRALYSLLLHTLHRHLILQGNKLSVDQIRQTLTRIGDDPALSQAVRSFTLYKLGSSALDSAIFSSRSFPNLSDITLDQLSIDERQLDQLLISIDKHPFSFRLSEGIFKAYNSFATAKRYDLNGPLPRFTSLSITNHLSVLQFLPILIYWTSTPTLEHLSLDGDPNLITGFLRGRLTRLPSVPFPRLKTLRLSGFWYIDVRLFESMPALEELCFIHPCLDYYPNTLHLPEQSLPRLRQYDGVAEYVMPIVHGRPIHSVTLSGRTEGFSYSSLGTPMLNLGSLTLIRCLTLKYTTDPFEALIFAASAFPALYELTITAAYKCVVTPVGNFTAARHTSAADVVYLRQSEFVSGCIKYLRRFTELRHLVYGFLNTASGWAALPWERRVCEVLEQTAPNIKSVRLSLAQWRKSDIDGSWYHPRLGTIGTLFTPSKQWPDPAGP